MSGFLVQFFFVSAVSASTLISGRPQVTDGDTLNFGAVSIRLHGIDAPEAGQNCPRPEGASWACGTAATEALAALVAGQDIRCEALDRDRFDRVIARCEAGGRDLGQALVESGLAWAYTRYSDAYTADEARAKAAGLGIWSAPSQTPAQTAWDYRSGRWSEAAGDVSLEDCPIKGNISKSGERIYHMPWSPAWAKTSIREDQGERWFCDEAEARAAGWRPARWK
ncbi:thermonuclease family protein [Pseudogemmobacter bohemicus]|uniref:thermonuclease family protein n=1 Tax=Pseudogemmobacter bohemicus TaxID=2250708 RepID=UPI000DD46616|nr:thermonuclease family protein [Pseudogemmobacter bohemicus]